MSKPHAKAVREWLEKAFEQTGEQAFADAAAAIVSHGMEGRRGPRPNAERESAEKAAARLVSNEIGASDFVDVKVAVRTIAKILTESEPDLCHDAKDVQRASAYTLHKSISEREAWLTNVYHRWERPLRQQEKSVGALIGKLSVSK